jgi:hypothetical protein
MNEKSIEIMKRKASSAALSNISCVVGLIENYALPYDLALALHACGNASVSSSLCIACSCMRGHAHVLIQGCMGMC